MAFVQKKINEGLARKQKDLDDRHQKELEELRRSYEARLTQQDQQARSALERQQRETDDLRRSYETKINDLQRDHKAIVDVHTRELNDLRKDHESKVADLGRTHTALLEKRERELKDKSKEDIEARSEQLSSEFADEFSRQEQNLKAHFAAEKKAFEEEYRKRAESELARDKRDLEDTYQTRLRKREEDLKERFDADLRSREAELRRTLDLEYRQKLTEAQAKLEEDLRNRSKDLATASEQAALHKIEMEKARLESEMTHKLDTEVSRVELEHRQKLATAEMDLKEKTAAVIETQKHKIEDDFRVRLLKRGRYSRLSRMLKTPLFPFPAFVGLEKSKRALLLNAINPNVNGVVLWGREGNGKFSLLLSFAEMLAPLEKDLVGKDDEFKPWNDEERYLTGRIHYGKEMAVYLIDTYLQCAALSLPSSHKRIEGQGSTEMPQLLLSTLKDEDEHAYHLISGYTLHVEVASPNTVEERLEIMHRNSDFRKDPSGFREKYRSSIEETLANVGAAREKVGSVAISTKILALVARMTILDKQSARLDVLMEQLARTNSAFEGRSEVDPTDVMEAADLALMHRLTPRELADLERSIPHEGANPRPK
jgi:hypothetical protein